MPSTVCSIDTSQIKDWDTFHDVFARELGFPSFYGRNMNAWIDCMTSLDQPDDGMTSVHAPPGGVLTLQLVHVAGLASRCPDIYEALIDCSAFVNFRRVEVGEAPVLALAYHRTASE